MEICKAHLCLPRPLREPCDVVQRRSAPIPRESCNKLGDLLRQRDQTPVHGAVQAGGIRHPRTDVVVSLFGYLDPLREALWDPVLRQSFASVYKPPASTTQGSETGFPPDVADHSFERLHLGNNLVHMVVGPFVCVGWS